MKKATIFLLTVWFLATGYAQHENTSSTITGSGVPGVIPVFVESQVYPTTVISNSIIFQKNESIGIGLTNPLAGLHVSSNLIAGNKMSRISLGSAYSASTDYGTGYLGFNALRASNEWQFLTDGAHNGGSVIYSNVMGSLRFVTINSGSNGAVNQYLSDEDIKESTKMFVSGRGNIGIGTDTPISKLHVHNGNLIISKSDEQSIITENTLWFDPIYKFPDSYVEEVVIGTNYAGSAIRFYTEAPPLPNMNNNHYLQLVAGGIGFKVWNDDVQYNAGYIGASGIQLRTPNDEIFFDVSSHSGLHTPKIITEEIEVKPDMWSDYVFHPDYKLLKLNELEAYVKENQHLPKIPTEEVVAKEGIELGEMNQLLLEKIEELTLYIIQINKEIDELKNKIQ